MFTKEDLKRTWEEELERANTYIKTLASCSDEDDAFLREYNRLEILLNHLSGSTELMTTVHPDSAVRDLADDIESRTKELVTQLSQSTLIYKRFTDVAIEQLDNDSARLVEHTLRDFRRSGVDANDDVKAEVSKIQKKITQISQTFGKNIREDQKKITVSKEDLVDFPEDFIAAHPADETGKITITTDYTDVGPFMKFCKNPKARKALAIAQLTRAYPQNTAILKDLITARHELATLLGYSSWASYVIGSAEAVEAFIEELTAAARLQGEHDLQELLKQKQYEEPNATEVFGYDSAYYSEKLRQEKYTLDAKEVRSYFSYNAVKQGLLDVTAVLFSLTYKAVKEETWHESVDVFAVHDAITNVQLGKIYLDMHPRENKYSHAAQFTIRSGVKDVQLPEGVLVCNFSDPAKSKHALMEHSDVITFFHEFGHLIHHVLGGNQRYISFSGVATEWDFVEAPSQFLEEWAWNYDVLKLFAKHYETGKTIPKELVEKMRAADTFGNGAFVCQQAFYTALSYELYAKDPKHLDIQKLEDELQKEHSLFAPYGETHFHANFGHLDGYSAIYYTYMWSLVIAKDLLTMFDQENLMDSGTAATYRKAILEKGGSKDAHELVRDFLGRDYTIDAFKAWLALGHHA